MVKWKCSICWMTRQSEVKPHLLERLCEDCAVTHWRKVVEIYKHEKGMRLEEARLKLKAAQAALKAYRATSKEVKA